VIADPSSIADPLLGASVTDDLFFGGRLRLVQPRRGHRFGGDAALLAAAALSRLDQGAPVADLGAGVGAVGLALAAFGAGDVALVEIEAALSALSAENATRNGLAGRVRAICADVADVGRPERANGPSAASVRLVVTNPPFDAAPRFRDSPDAAKARAHIDRGDVVGVWVAAAARLLEPGGSLVMIHRPEALGTLLAALGGRFGDVRIRPVHPRAEAPAGRLLVAARTGRGGPLAVLPPLVMHASDGGFTAEAEAAQRGEAAIAMD
jgi:tRNA1(Val) A37 N6-methylase TrmN6